MGFVGFKKKIQEALGSNIRQSQGNRAKAKSGGKIYQNAGDVIEGISEEELNKWFAELKEQINIDNVHLQKTIEKTIDNVLVSKVAKIVAETYKDHCNNNPPDKKLVLSLIEIQTQATNITQDIQTIFAEQRETSIAVKEVKGRLQKIQERLTAEIEDLCGLCENILFWSRETHNLCKTQLTSICTSQENMEKYINTIFSEGGIFAQYMQLAEIRHKELMSALSRTNKEESLLSPQLDLRDIATMFEWIKDIPSQMQNESATLEDVVSNHVNELSCQIYKIKQIIDHIEDQGAEILKQTAESLAIAIDTNIRIKGTEPKLNEILKILKNRDTYRAQVDSTSNEEDRIKYAAKIEQVELQLQKKIRELEIERSNGQVTPNMPCLFCGYKAERKVIGGECVCSVCGHRFTDISPDISNVSDEQVKKGSDWKILHTAELEKVSEDIGNTLYRMRIGPYTVSSAGVLIIPSRDNTGKRISKVAFCQPNTDDKKGNEMLLKVRKLFLGDGVTLSEFNGRYPFAEIIGLESVMKRDGDGFVEDQETLQKIKVIGGN